MYIINRISVINKILFINNSIVQLLILKISHISVLSFIIVNPKIQIIIGLQLLITSYKSFVKSLRYYHAINFLKNKFNNGKQIGLLFI